MSHECHAIACTTPVPPRMMMCGRHWRLVPKDVQQLVWGVYVEGQEIRKDPSAEYILVQAIAVAEVAKAEGRAAGGMMLEAVMRAWVVADEELKGLLRPRLEDILSRVNAAAPRPPLLRVKDWF